MNIPTAVVRVASLALVVSVIGCNATSNTGTASIPSAPSASAPAPAGATGNATITGTLGALSATASASSTAVMVTITITGTGISTTVAPGGTFVLNGVPNGTVELHFTGTGIDARATVPDVSDGEAIQIVVALHGTTAAVTVTDRKKPGAAQELEGLISGINLAMRTLVVNGTMVSVPTTAIIRHGNQSVTLSELKIGQRVHIRGTLSGTTLVASEVMLQDENPPNQDEADVEGTVSARSGARPALTFVVRATKVSTDAATHFEDGTCATIANGVKVEVEGVRHSDGSIKATQVEVNKADD